MIRRSTITILFLAIVIAIAAGFFASTNPDGLEKVAKDLKFDKGVLATPAVAVDYTRSIMNVPVYSTAVTGIFGILIVFFLYRFISRGNKITDSIKEILKTITKKE